jgi:hypothetical protein
MCVFSARTILHIISLYASTFVWEWGQVLMVSLACPEFIEGNHSVLQREETGVRREQNNRELSPLFFPFSEHPILYFQIRHTLELFLIARHECGIKE